MRPKKFHFHRLFHVSEVHKPDLPFRFHRFQLAAFCCCFPDYDFSKYRSSGQCFSDLSSQVELPRLHSWKYVKSHRKRSPYRRRYFLPQMPVLLMWMSYTFGYCFQAPSLRSFQYQAADSVFLFCADSYLQSLP